MQVDVRSVLVWPVVPSWAFSHAVTWAPRQDPVFGLPSHGVLDFFIKAVWFHLLWDHVDHPLLRRHTPVWGAHLGMLGGPAVLIPCDPHGKSHPTCTGPRENSTEACCLSC